MITETQKLKGRIEYLESTLAITADLLNTWCRVEQVEECKHPYYEYGLRSTIDRLWAKLSSERAEALCQPGYDKVIYACQLCGFAHCHRLIYCPKCPGTMVIKTIHVPGTSNFEVFQKTCEENGVHYEGEYRFDIAEYRRQERERNV